MTTQPSEEAGATTPQHGTPGITVGSEGDSRSTDSPAGRSQGQIGGTEKPAAQQPVSQPASEEAMKLSEGVPEDSKKPTEATTLLSQSPDSLQASRSLPNPPLVKLVEDKMTSHSQLILPQHLLNTEETPPGQGDSSEGCPLNKEEMPSSSEDPSEGPPLGKEKTPSSPGDPSERPPPTVEAQLPGEDTQASSNTEDTQASLGALEDKLVDISDQPSSLSLPSSPSPTTHPEWRPLDSSLYMANQDASYMHSMTSLLGGGEGSIGSLGDILVWSDATVDMATDILATGHGCVTDLLQGTGPSLCPASSLLDSATLVLSSGLSAGTGLALRSVTSMLEAFERRTIEGIRSAVRFLTRHLTPPQAPAAPSCD
ncbi:PREDICTED: uncharacterized protein C2orf57 homolog [Elephantulus edwardii]|uniref:uncharacterized protein C2orf57 homolog n=1 Tax=Elephantulus edwardii TaxID=28737 RepID=UPI0003F0CA5F|nr:PREDICTED: uncharacterized protein C2orf57 homolog [Elephantulus edwardii]